MKILGIASENHDAGLALLKDGAPLTILEEERLNREKHTLDFPFGALKTVFGEGLCSLDEIDVITTPWDVRRLRRNYLRAIWARFPASLNLLRAGAQPTQDRATVFLNFWMRRDFRSCFGPRRLPDIINVGHHESHAAIFFASPFEDATVLVMDGHGDDAATSAFTSEGERLERRWHGHFLDSLGVIYTLITRHLGFRIFEEGTVMALAACGGDRYVKPMRDLVHLLDEGRFAINMEYFSYDRYGLLKPFSRKFLDLFGPARRRDELLNDRHRALAHALQTVTEETILHVTRHLSRRYPSRNLCLTGGVALNCVANARILRDTDYQRIWVPPCASDTGAPLGSALWHYHQTLGHSRQFEMTHAFFGRSFTNREIESAFDQMAVNCDRLSEAELIARVARDLAAGKIVGWFQGREEIGPRALGARSILASPIDPRIREVINARIKHREPFRPFAPAVLQEYAAEYFEISQPEPFMTTAPRVRPDRVNRIPAAVHVDGTARVQTVDYEHNPRYYRVIEEFMRLTGVPVILNTSFNKQEPIVSRPEEAISCFLRTEMDALALGDFYTTDRNPVAANRAKEAFKAAKAWLRGGK